MKGVKRTRNIPVLYDEIKKPRATRLTDTAWKGITETAKQQGISASELMERWGRQLILLVEKSVDGD
ncbi:hypothetical protein G7B40_018175 [Aetokthonos hydrillicola Thurmond2011]|jgi:hypothetical protein|uniref:Uncharacterized protein n=1 Tax=Aetokthonos hydrillicola Thurmond2011 TaxID=2712845 RepID=A0AAP5IAE1_9CYAN|nr:hypothetical protein [Aetokthonos hydrillicola]MBO3460371.1 hypothetical protein [Aetokthonos hydrillicola CCALA 1050]MBW4588362.1 hypothetical protein [Aetokthonos hydrillicola CCALA 1050]MDR9896472.1 hypothetical protein [Aetokthonos hydrillicola Thurmond2011]